jgi:hypothetical protein
MAITESGILGQPLVREAFDQYDDFTLFKRAEDFYKQYQQPMNNSQVYGLSNVAQSTNAFEDIEEFIDRQRLKLEREQNKHKEWMIKYWIDLLKEIRAIRLEVNEIWKKLKAQHLQELHFDPLTQEKEVNHLVLSLVRGYINHLIAENGMKEKRA